MPFTGRIEGHSIAVLNPAPDDAIVVVMPYVYILRCRDGALYVGQADDVLRREQAHNEGRGARFTAARRPVRAVYAEYCATAPDATVRERQLKCWTRAKKEALIAGDAALLKRL